MEAELEELKNRWIISEKDPDERKLRQYVKRLMNYCEITKAGGVSLTKISENFSLKNKVRLTLVARFVANKLDNSIAENVSAEEISKFFLVDKKQVNARLKEIRDDKFALREEKGIYKLNPSKLDAFLNELDEKYGVKK